MNHITTAFGEEFIAPTRELTTEEREAGYLPASRCEEFNPVRTDFRWTADFAAFLPVHLRWWDDVSYAAYQAADDAREPLCGRFFDLCNMPEVPAPEAAVSGPDVDAVGPDYHYLDDDLDYDTDDMELLARVEAEQWEENVAPEGRCPSVVALCDDNAILF